MTDLSDEALDRLLGLHAAGTQGEISVGLCVEDARGVFLHGGGRVIADLAGPSDLRRPNADKIASFVNAGPALVAEVKALRAERDGLRGRLSADMLIHVPATISGGN